MGTASSRAARSPEEARSAETEETRFVLGIEQDDDDESFHNAVERLEDETTNDAAAAAAAHRELLLQDARDNNNNNNNNRMEWVQLNNPRNDAEDASDADFNDLEDDLIMERIQHPHELLMMEQDRADLIMMGGYYEQQAHNNAPRLTGHLRAVNRRLRYRRLEIAAMQRHRPHRWRAEQHPRFARVEQNLQEHWRVMMMMRDADTNHHARAMDDRRVPVVAAARRAPLPLLQPPPDPRVLHKRRLERGTETWTDVPSDLQQDQSFARSIQGFSSSRLLRSILQAHPALANDKEYWKHIFPLTSNIKAQVASLFKEFADESFFQDDEFMHLACKNSPRIQLLLQGEKREKGRYYWQSLIDQNPLVLGTLPHSVQRRFPDMIDETLPVLGRMPWPERDMDLIPRVAPNMAPEFWRDRENLRKWFTAGLPLHPPKINTVDLVADLKHDKQVFRWIAQHCRSSLKAASFSCASLELRSDKAFMLECVAIDPRVLKCAVEGIRQDFDLVLTACAGPRGLVSLYLEETRFLVGQAKFIPRFHARIRNMHQSNQCFHPVVLQGMTSCSGSPLALLSDNVKKIIATEFLDASATRGQINRVEVAVLNLDAIRGVPST